MFQHYFANLKAENPWRIFFSFMNVAWFETGLIKMDTFCQHIQNGFI